MWLCLTLYRPPIGNITQVVLVKRKCAHICMAEESSSETKITYQDWVEYRKNPTKEFEDRVLREYDYIPRTHAYSFLRKKPHLLDIEDLIQAGRMGLMQALTRYDPEKKVLFKTFATLRVNGAILDQINSTDWTPRPVRERIKTVIKAIEKLNGEAGDRKTDAALIAAQIEGMTLEEVEQVLEQMNKTYISHIDGDMLGLMEHTGLGPDQRTKNQRIRTVMNVVLNYDERMVIELKFFGGYKDYEITEQMNITQAQLKLIEKRALEKLAFNLSYDDFSG